MTKILFKNGEIVKVTNELVAKFLQGKTTPIETVAVLIAAKYDKLTSFVLRRNMPYLWMDITVERDYENSISTQLF